jgi:hypothetical protein
MPLKDLVKEDAVDEAAETDAEQDSRTAKTRYGLPNLLLAGDANSHAGALPEALGMKQVRTSKTASSGRGEHSFPPARRPSASDTPAAISLAALAESAPCPCEPG